MTKLAWIAAVAGLLAGCAGTPPAPPPDMQRLALPPAALMEPPGRMPDVPACGMREQGRVACRLAYDAAQRGQCADIGERLIGLQAYLRALHGDRLPAPQTGGTRSRGV